MDLSLNATVPFTLPATRQCSNASKGWVLPKGAGYFGSGRANWAARFGPLGRGKIRALASSQER